jgi:hypothetical protein
VVFHGFWHAKARHLAVAETDLLKPFRSRRPYDVGDREEGALAPVVTHVSSRAKFVHSPKRRVEFAPLDEMECTLNTVKIGLCQNHGSLPERDDQGIDMLFINGQQILVIGEEAQTASVSSFRTDFGSADLR